MSSLVHEIIEVISDSNSGFEQKVNKLLSFGKKVVGADAVLMSKINSYNYHISFSQGSSQNLDSFYLLEQMYCHDVVNSKEMLYSTDISNSKFSDKYFFKKHKHSSFLSVPLVIDSIVVGTILFLSNDPLQIDKERLGFIQLIQHHIQDCVRYDDVQSKFDKYYNLLEKKNEELNKFSYTVAHDLKSPLRAISTLVGFMGEDIEDGNIEELPNHFNLIESKSNEAYKLIEDILEYSKLGATEVASDTIPLKYFINDICFEIALGGANVEVFNNVEEVSLLNKKVFLYQTVSNILNNAIKYTDKEKAIVEINSIDKGDVVEVSIEDNGPGIPDKYKNKIFEVFQVAHTRTDVESTGIGLSIVQKLIEKMGGEVHCEDSTKLGGAKFVFTISKNIS